MPNNKTISPISNNNHNNRVLFKTTNLNDVYCHDADNTLAQKCCHFVKSFQASIQPVTSSSIFSYTPLSLFDEFKPLSLSDFKTLVSTTSSSTCSLDLIPPRLLKEAFSSVGPSH